MPFRLNGYRWSGPYPIGRTKPLRSQVYYLIVTLDGQPVAVGALADPVPGQEIIARHKLTNPSQYRIGYQSLEQDDNFDVQNQLDLYRELYVIE